ncbi:MAG TPA: hypothetical protein VHR84_03365 [Terriglobales bacterium]|jgi:hypothetical protein|nr:hypothetical protein [Terriglobales bacterium]
MSDQFDITQAVSLDFLRTELETGMTFAKVALSANNEDKIRRNQLNARKAYDSFQRYKSRPPVSDADAEELKAKAVELKKLLIKLGETL